MEPPSFLDSLFHTNNSNSQSNQLINSNSTSLFFQYITNPSTSEQDLTLLFQHLLLKLKQCRMLYIYFSYYNSQSIYIYLINIYINTSSLQLQQSILNVIKEYRTHISLSKDVFTSVYSHFASLQRNPQLTSSLQINSLLLFLQELSYTVNEDALHPYNYFCFNGKGYLHVKIPKTVNINITQWVSLVLHFKTCESNIYNDNNNSKYIANIIQMNFTNDISFNVKLKNIRQISISINDNKEIIRNIPFNEWINLIVNFYYKDNNKFVFDVFINREHINFEYEIHSHTPIDNNNITSISFFQNFFGEATSIMLLNSHLTKENTYQNNVVSSCSYIQTIINMKEGLWKNSLIERFMQTLHGLDNDNDKKINYKRKDENVHKAHKVYDDIKFLFIPNANNTNIINDIFCNCEAILHGDGRVHTYESYHNNMKIINNDILNLLPIAEMLLVNVHLLTNDMLINYVQLINVMLTNSSENAQHAMESKFFEVLALFIEKLPHEVFTIKVLGKFALLSQAILDMKNNELINVYFENIFLNQQILIKYNDNLHFVFWDVVNLYCQRDPTFLQTQITMNKLCDILQLYDSNKYNKMCCEEHYNQFNITTLNVMNPSMKAKLCSLQGIVLKCINNSQSSANSMLLFKLLIYNVSPCLAKFIINIYKELFTSSSKEEEKLISLYKGMFVYRCEIILKNTFKHSLLDIRLDIIDLLKELYAFTFTTKTLLKDYSHKLRTLLDMIKVCLLPGYSYYIYDNPNTNDDNNSNQHNLNDIKALAFHCAQKLTPTNHNSYYLQQCKQFKGKHCMFNHQHLQQYIDSLYDKLFAWSVIDYKNKENKSEIVQHFSVLNMALNLTEKLNDITYYNTCLDKLNEFAKHKENCYEMLKHKVLFMWMIKLAYDNHNRHLNDKTNLYHAVIKLIMKIIQGTLDEISNQNNGLIMHKLQILFIWGDIMLLKNTNDNITEYCNVLCQFLKVILNYIIMIFNNTSTTQFHENIKEKTCKNYIDKYKENYLILASIIFEFNFYFKFDSFIITNNNPTTKQSYCNSNSNIKTTFESFNKLIQNVSLNTPNTTLNVNTIENSLINFELFCDLLHKVNFIWNPKRIYTTKTLSLKSIFKRYETILKEIIYDKEKKNEFIEELTFLCTNKSNPNIIPLIINIPISLAIIIHISRTALKNEQQVKQWTNEFRHFICFIILASTNALNTNQTEQYKYIQQKCIDVIFFSLWFLRNELTKYKNEIGKEYVNKTFKHILTFCFLIMYNQYKYKEKHKGLRNKLSKPSRNNLSSCAVFQLFNEYVVVQKNLNSKTNTNMNDKQSVPLLTLKMLEEAKSNEFENMIDSVNEHLDWIRAMFENEILLNRMNDNYIRVSQYETNAKMRIDNIKKKNMTNTTFNNDIQSLLTQYDQDFRNYTNKDNKSLICKHYCYWYKKIKKKLFSWNRNWSDRSVFYRDTPVLKQKVLNHYTKFFSKPCVVPILDMEYYLPKFTQFNKEKLFRKDTHQQCTNNICLDIHSILNTNDQKNNVNEVNETNCFIFIKDVYMKSYSDLYYSYLQIQHNKRNSQHINNDNISLTNQTFNIPQIQSNKNSSTSFPTYSCCLIKPSYHIQGTFTITDTHIAFQVISNNNLNQNNSAFDKENERCYGSCFKCPQKEYDRPEYIIKYTNINMLLRRRYYYKNSGLEIFTISNKSYYFDFKLQNPRELALTQILSHIKHYTKLKDDLREPKTLFDNKVGFQVKHIDNKKKQKVNLLSKLITSWCNWEISTYEMLMWLNIFANRSFIDITQYPVMPWILTDYSTKFEHGEYEYRDLTVPMGMLTVFDQSKTRKKEFITNYKILKEESLENKDTTLTPYVYGSHYSTPIYVCNYLLRLFPFTNNAIEFQGAGFDTADRLFFSLDNSFYSSATIKADIRELTPEFYFFPELFMNLNNINLGTKEDKESVNNVLIPFNNNAFKVIATLRKILESPQVSAMIPKWIDLIFGYKQRGKEAELAYNVFTEKTYEDLVDVNKEEDKDILFKMVEFGLTPQQVITKEFPLRCKKESVKKLKEVTDKETKLKVWSCWNKFSKKVDNCEVIKVQLVDNEKLCMVYNNNYITHIKVQVSHLDCKTEVSKSICIPKYKLLYKINELYISNSIMQFPGCFINGGKALILGGFGDGKVVSISLDNNLNVHEIKHSADNSACTVIEVDKEEEYLLCGNAIGNIYMYKIESATQFTLVKEMFDFENAVSSINISNDLNLWCACSKEGFVHIYTMPCCKLIRSIKLPTNANAKFVLMVASPLTCVVIICKEDLFVYNVNGYLVSQEKLDKAIESPVIIKDLFWNEYLCYIVEEVVYIKSLPFLNIVTTVNVKHCTSYLCVSDDALMLYGVSKNGNEIVVIKDHQKEVKSVEDNSVR